MSREVRVAEAKEEGEQSPLEGPGEQMQAQEMQGPNNQATDVGPPAPM